ncbi:M23 family metallopeptidase [Qipengyuania sp.]|uniref:M23 family metallopeptidase n=1 Tax=Qipengyuania sp. TaxID=2004515 RepID=UPI0035C83B2E
MKNTFAKLKIAGLAALAGFTTIAAAPAQAESAAYVAPVAAPAAGSGVSQDGADRQFTQLFASWGRTRANPVTPAVSVPSVAPLASYRMSSDYGMRVHPVLGRRQGHKGVDMAAAEGTPVYATADGIVSRASRWSSYGNFISIEHGGTVQTRFAHLSGYAVSEGQRVQKGDLIGYVGSTGRSTGPHLHYEVRVDGEAVNPVDYMTETSAQAAFALVHGGGSALGGSK